MLTLRFNRGCYHHYGAGSSTRALSLFIWTLCPTVSQGHSEASPVAAAGPCVEGGEVCPPWCGMALLGQREGDWAGPWICRRGGRAWMELEGPQASPAFVSPAESSFRFSILALGIGSLGVGYWGASRTASGWPCVLPRDPVLTCGRFVSQRCLPQPAPGAGCWAPGESLSADRVVSVRFGSAVEFHRVGRWRQLVTTVVMGASLRTCRIPPFFQGHKQQQDFYIRRRNIC